MPTKILKRQIKTKKQSCRIVEISASGFYHLLVFSEREVILAECDDEDDGSDALEAVDPLLTLRPLSANVEHSGTNDTCYFHKRRNGI